MKLVKAQIRNCRCIDDTTPFSVGAVTCLVGKNESGKTAILQAMGKLNPYDAAKGNFEKLRDYPRRYLSQYNARHPDVDASVVETTWVLDAEDVAVVEARLGKGCLQKAEVTLSKGYDNILYWNVPLNEAEALGTMIANLGLTDSERQAVTHIKSVEVLGHYCESEPAPPVALTQLLAKLGEKSLGHYATDVLLPRLPKFLYFASYDKMSGNVSINKLQQDTANNIVSDGDKVFKAFLEFAGSSVEEMAGAKKFEDLQAKIEAASIRISDQIFEYWSQNQNLKVRVLVAEGRPDDPPPFNSGKIVRTRIENLLHQMTVDFDERSQGFVWFFSFLVMFSQIEKEKGNVIILLDEPGLNLHAKAQADLLRFVSEKLSNRQVIYTTHSPFMVPPDNLSAVRTVEDVVKRVSQFKYDVLGTKVGDEVLSTDRDTLFPLQGALGYEITQSLFIGEQTLLVEGPSDILYLNAFSAELRRRARTNLDKRWTLCPAGGVDKVSAFVSLFAGNKLHVAVLTDFMKGQKAKIEQLRKSKLLNDGHVFTAVDFCAQDEADIEDLLGETLYLQLVNGAYALGQNALTAENVSGQSQRVLIRVEDAFRTMPSTVPEFDHFTPSRWLLENPAVLSTESTEVLAALEKFERLFLAVNALLPSPG